jgi:3-phosphoshikimate 1-carboxyvinyltransferase
MKVEIQPAALTGVVPAIASKSDAHRHLICAAFADRPTELLLNTSSEDIETTASCLRALGAGIVSSEGALLVDPVQGSVTEALLDCAESGSTLRFMLPVAASCCEQVHLTGRGRLPERPLGELVSVLRENGVELSSDKLPISTRGRLKSGRFALPGNISSQYITGLLLALPLLEGASEIVLTTNLESTDYVNITLKVLEQYGIAVEQTDCGFRVPGGQSYRSPGTARIEGDWSNAAFFLAAGALGAPVSVAGLSPDSPQGDRRIVDLLRLFGAEITQDSDTVSVTPKPLRAATIDIGETDRKSVV